MKLAASTAALLCACAGPGAPSDSGALDEWGGVLVLEDAHTFSYEAAVDIERVPLTTNGGVRLDWSTLGQDMLGHAIDPATELDAAFITVWAGLSPQELADFVARDELPQAELSLFVRSPLDPDRSDIALAEFNTMGTDVAVEQYFEEGSGTWMAVLVSEGADVISAYRKLLFLEPTAGEEADTARFTDESSRFEVSAELEASATPRVPAGETFPVDWSGLGIDGLGRSLALHKIDRLTVAWYEDLRPADLEAQFIDLYELADAQWDLEVEGMTEADLALAAGPTGAFSGFSSAGTWLVALRCGSCSSPMPIFVSVIDAQR